MELEAANAKGNSRQLFRIVKSMTQKFQPRLQCIRSATGKNLTEAAQIADRWKGYCEDLYHDDEGKGTEQEYWEQEPPPLRSDVARAIRQTASHKATGPDEVPAELFGHAQPGWQHQDVDKTPCRRVSQNDRGQR